MGTYQHTSVENSMLRVDAESQRQLQSESIHADLIVVGGGLAGTCAAITAAREGLKVVLVQDRPVLGGNASSEIRLWILGATSHMGNNNRWSREGGVINEIMVENTFRNPEGNPVLLDALLVEKVTEEPNLTLLLNTSVYEVNNGDQGQIESAIGFCSQNSTQYELIAPLFCDASGDGILGFLSGAAFRIGAESREEFQEALAPLESHNKLLGHTIFFYTKDTGRPVRYVPPSFALNDITEIPRYRRFNTKEQGVALWWLEYGGSKDTIHDSELIKSELWRIIYGIWDYIKNSGEHPDAETFTLDWVGLIPGKRESRRFEGDYMLVQQDIVEQRMHPDAVSVGGWAIDLHPVDNIYSDEAPCTQWHSKGVYQVPYRTMYSRNVPNLFLAGRIISSSHIAFGSTRVMASCAHNAQAVGVAAAICREQGLKPRDITKEENIKELQLRLLRTGQHIPQIKREDPKDLAQKANISASSSMTSLDLTPSDANALTESRAILVPIAAGQTPKFRLTVRHQGSAKLVAELRTCSRSASYTPDVLLDTAETVLHTKSLSAVGSASSAGDSGILVDSDYPSDSSESYGSNGNHSDWTDTEVSLSFDAQFNTDCYAFLCLRENPAIEVYDSNMVLTGVTSVVHRQDPKVARSSKQIPPENSGIDSFEYWVPVRRPKGCNLSIKTELDPGLFAPENVTNGFQRPGDRPNAWVSSLTDPNPTLKLSWSQKVRVKKLQLVFDPDWDHAMESIVMTHPERVMPTVVHSFRVYGPGDQLLAECQDNHSTIVTCTFDSPIDSDTLRIELDHPSVNTPASLFEVRCYDS